MLENPNKTETMSLLSYYLGKIETEDSVAYYNGSLLETISVLESLYHNDFLPIYKSIIKDYSEEVLDEVDYDWFCKRFIDATFKENFKDSEEYVEYIMKDFEKQEEITRILNAVDDCNRNLGFERKMIKDLLENYTNEKDKEILIEPGNLSDIWCTNVGNMYSSKKITEMGLKISDIIKDEIKKEFESDDVEFDLDTRAETLILGYGIYEYNYQLLERVLEEI